MEAAATTPATRSAALHREGLAWAFAGVVMFSFSVPLTKVAVGGFSPFFTATGRAVIAGLLAAIVLWVRRAPLPRDHLRPLLYTMSGAVFGWPILLALALQRTTSAHVAVIAAFMPLTTALIAALRTHERDMWQFWAEAGIGTWLYWRCHHHPGLGRAVTRRWRRSAHPERVDITRAARGVVDVPRILRLVSCCTWPLRAMPARDRPRYRLCSPWCGRSCCSMKT
jgi:uncharacterized membrane protein